MKKMRILKPERQIDMEKYKPYVKRYWYCFLLGPFFMILEACGEFLLPYINANIINIGAAEGNIPYILENSLWMVLLTAGMLLTGILGANFAIRGAAHLAAGVRSDTFKKIQRFSFDNIDRFTTGSLITRITNDITQIQSFTQLLLRGVFRSPIMVIGALVMSFLLNPSLALVILIVVPLLGGAIAAIILISSPRYTKMQAQLDTLNVNIQETITNERVIKSFVREDHHIEKFDGVNEELVKKSTSALKMMLLMQPASTLAINITTLAVVWIAGKQIMIGDMELGTLSAFITYLTQVLNALRLIANIVLRGTRAAASDRRISEVLNAAVDLNDENAAQRDHVVSSGEIRFEKVCYRYFKHNTERVLDSISLTIKSGELVGVIGSTGCGKSTLVSLIPRLYDPDSGAVYVDGVNVKDLSLKSLRDSVAMVLQKNTLFTGTIAENLRWGNENATDEELNEAAEIASAAGFIRAFPNSYDTELGQGGGTLSGGQKQRLCIARALLKKPKIIILDDSTSAVDTATDASIRRAFREKLPGVTKIIIAQRINSVIDADKIVVVDAGRIVGCGKHEELMENCPQYREIYWSQKDRENELSERPADEPSSGSGNKSEVREDRNNG